MSLLVVPFWIADCRTAGAETRKARYVVDSLEAVFPVVEVVKAIMAPELDHIDELSRLKQELREKL